MAQIVAALQQILGQQGENLCSEREILMVESFSGKSSEDPISWLNKFERAKIANRWTEARLVDIAGGLMKGEAAAWYDRRKGRWGNNPSRFSHPLNAADGNGNNANFKNDFKEEFINDQRKNDWYDQLMNLKQGSDNTVEEYVAKFIKLIKRCEITDEAQKKRIFLFGLNPAYVTFVQMGNHETLEAMISGAKKIEAGFNLSTGRIGSKNKKKEEIKKSEIDALTKQINQLNTNYADLVTAFLAQTSEASSSTQKFQSRNNQNPRNRPPPRDKRDITCYACEKQGHYTRDYHSRRNDGNNRGNNNRRDDNRKSNNFDRNNNFNRGRS
jgi:hypothetical protein